MTSFAQDQIFTNLSLPALDGCTEFEACTFNACNLAAADLSHIRFVDCFFINCDLSNAVLAKTTLADVSFTGCKLLGLHFQDCTAAPFAVSFENCSLKFSSFYRRALTKTALKNCVLHEVDFTEANLTAASFAGSDLQRALFENAVLEKADFRTAFNFSIDPERNRLKKARFSREALAGLLEKYGLDIS